jgi:hypothetical protein
MSQFGGGGWRVQPTPWYKENPFWGGIGGFFSFLLAGVGFGVTGYPTLGGWLLAGSFPWGVLAIWIALGGIIRRKLLRIGSRIAAILCLGLILALSAARMGKTKAAIASSAEPHPPSSSQLGAQPPLPNSPPSPSIVPPEPPIERTAKISVMVPFDTAPNAFPIPMDNNPDDPLFNIYSEFNSLAMNGTVPDSARESKETGTITWHARPVSLDESTTFLAHLLQYYILRTIDGLQHDSLTQYVGYPAEPYAGIEPPDARDYSAAKLSKLLADNRFYRPFLYRKSFDLTKMKMPKGTVIEFRDEDDKSLDKCTVVLRRSGYFKADFTVRVFAGTGPGSPPKHFVTAHPETVMQWPFFITMRYSIEHPKDSTFIPQNYAKWLDALYDGLHKKLEMSESEKRSR